MAWIITRDLLPDRSAPAPSNLNAHGLTGPRLATDTSISLLRSGVGKPFRILDDDGIVYYHGLWLNTPDCDPYDAPEFQPLDDFGAPNAGATEIQYRNLHGQWETL